MHYSKIALALKEISGSTRSTKVDRTSVLLCEAAKEPKMLCPVVRLLTGELWPRWEDREMGIGPGAIAAALADVCDIDLIIVRQQKGDLGLVAEAALQHKDQNSLFGEPLDALFVYEGMRRISTLRGSDSDQRKIAILRGMFLLATPLEGKFIARTALRSTQAGLGPRTIIAAISSALACDQNALGRAFGLMPDLGSIAELARLGRLDEVFIQPKLPAAFMIYSSRKEFFPAAYLPKFPGLRVQVHKKEDRVRIFTSQLREISSSLVGLCRDVGQLNADFVVDADLIGLLDSASGGASAISSICSQREMLIYINRRRLARKNSIHPALVAYDLLVSDGKDICSMAYADRRERMLKLLGPPRSPPFWGISPAEEWHLTDSGDLYDYLCRAERVGASGLLARDLAGVYLPGEVAERDFIIRVVHTLSALIVGVEWISRNKGEPRAKYLAALRDGAALVPVGWVWRTRSDCDCQPLSQAARSLEKYGSQSGANVDPEILLRIRIRGFQKVGGEFRIIEPVIEGYHLHSSSEDADKIEKLESFCSQ